MTNDGGAGMIQALGARLLDKEGQELTRGGGALDKLAQIDLTQFDQRIFATEVLVASDVNNPLTEYSRGVSCLWSAKRCDRRNGGSIR